MKQQNFTLCVQCLTYNQAPFIEKTMDGFCMQRTDFPFVCCIIDDASIDGEQKIISDYLGGNFILDDDISKCIENDLAKIIYARHKQNNNCYFVVVFLKNNLFNQPNGEDIKLSLISDWRDSCEYEAICEGDDYWVDENKLQMQVDYLLHNSECVLCYTGFSVVDENDVPTKNRYRELKCYSGDVFDKLLETNFVQTATIVSKVNLMDKALLNCHNKGLRSIDYAIFFELSLVGKFKYLPNITTHYRVCRESMSHSSSLLKEIKFALYLSKINDTYFNIKYGLTYMGTIKKYYKKFFLIFKIAVKHYLVNIIQYTK